MKIIVISGTQWGDEGKGKSVYYLTKFTDVCLRSIGGSNAEATFYHEDKAWRFRMLPIGILQNNVGLLTDGVVISCEHLMRETTEVEEAIGSLKNKFLISGNAHVVLPCHREKDSALDKDTLKIGTIGQGIGPAQADRASRIGFSVDQFIESEGEIAGVRLDKEYRDTYLELLKKYRANTKQYLSKINKTILVQGSQGFMLDNVHGSYPYVTSSHTSTAGLLQGAGLPCTNIDRNIGVVKATLHAIQKAHFLVKYHRNLKLMNYV